MKYFCYAYGCSTFLQRKKENLLCAIGKRIIGNGTESTEVLQFILAQNLPKTVSFFEVGKREQTLNFSTR